MKSMDFLKDKKVTILCSGPSVRNYSDSNEIVIVPNRSILLPQLSRYKNIIWIKGTGWQRNNVYSWWKELATEVECKPSVILARKSNPDWNPYFNRFEKEFSLIFDKVLPLGHAFFQSYSGLFGAIINRSLCGFNTTLIYFNNSGVNSTLAVSFNLHHAQCL